MLTKKVGTETTYTYDKQHERLQNAKLMIAGQTVMDNKYQYDAVDNILKAMWQSALTGAVSGAISGGIESYENCKDNGVNPFTGL